VQLQIGNQQAKMGAIVPAFASDVEGKEKPPPYDLKAATKVQ
jgi:hypothetical protein